MSKLVEVNEKIEEGAVEGFNHTVNLRQKLPKWY